jgi:MFS family permease
MARGTHTGHLVAAFANSRFRQLFWVRLACQFGDGVFQASLAGAVLFDPEHQGHATDIAAAFAVLLLPYSLIGPFAGVLLDRWWRQRILILANVLRAGVVIGVAAELASGVSGAAFYASGLVVISISRFVLAALSAALPRLVPAGELVTANAISSTAGTISAALGGAIAIGVRAVIGDSDRDYAVIAATSIVPFLLAALAARGFVRDALGPSESERRARETPAEVWRSLRAGAGNVRAATLVANGLGMIAVHRLCYGVWTVCTVLLYRNYFTDDGFFRAGLTGLSQVVAAVAVGGGLASFVTPAAFRHYGPVRWPVAMLLASAAVELACGLPYRKGLLVLAALLLAFTSQAIKISIDTLIQRDITDAYRGRVFALYDMLFNVALVLAAGLTASVLPASGHSSGAVLAIAGGYLVVAAAYVTTAGRPAARAAAARTTA